MKLGSESNILLLEVGDLQQKDHGGSGRHPVAKSTRLSGSRPGESKSQSNIATSKANFLGSLKTIK